MTPQIQQAILKQAGVMANNANNRAQALGTQLVELGGTVSQNASLVTQLVAKIQELENRLEQVEGRVGLGGGE